MTEYNEEDFLMLSGIQHFAFCRRQWALIHIEKQWNENYFTVDGQIFHERAHTDNSYEKRNDVLIRRGLPVYSRVLGISGICDIVEFHPSKNGVPLSHEKDLYLPVPIEYKRGSPKDYYADDLQLCAQAMCLEEMLLSKIDKGFLYYGETRHRKEIAFTAEMRELVKEYLKEMHSLFDKKYTPKVKTNKKCYACSLKDICLPCLNKSPSVKSYILKFLGE